MGIARHKLSNLDVGNKCADCAICGRVQVVLKSNKKVWCCRISQMSHQGVAARWKKIEGMDREKIEEIRRNTCGNCEICGIKTDGLVLDHDHATNMFRGLLCNSCNKGIGFFGDDPVALESAAQYLRNHCQKLA